MATLSMLSDLVIMTWIDKCPYIELTYKLPCSGLDMSDGGGCVKEIIGMWWEVERNLGHPILILGTWSKSHFYLPKLFPLSINIDGPLKVDCFFSTTSLSARHKISYFFHPPTLGQKSGKFGMNITCYERTFYYYFLYVWLLRWPSHDIEKRKTLLF